MKLSLQIIVNEKGDTRCLDLGQSTSIGRSYQNRIQIQEGYVSSRHAMISQSESGIYMIEDCGSKNGTFVNNQPVTSVPVKLALGDVVRFGLAACRVVESSRGGEMQLTTAQVCPAGQRTEVDTRHSSSSWPAFISKDYQPGFISAFRPVKKKSIKKKNKLGKTYLKSTQAGAKRLRVKAYDPFVSRH
jgi:FHA domain